MPVKHYDEVPAVPLAVEGADGVLIREVITDRDGAPHFAMRVFDIEPGGHSPLHDHDYEHEVFVLEGTGEVTEGERVFEIAPGSVVFIRAGVPHQFRNTSTDRLLRFICVIPLKRDA